MNSLTDLIWSQDFGLEQALLQNDFGHLETQTTYMMQNPEYKNTNVEWRKEVIQ